MKTDSFTPEKDFDVEVKIIFERAVPRTDIVKKFRWAFSETTCPQTT